jgi:WD40 repeat protein
MWNSENFFEEAPHSNLEKIKGKVIRVASSPKNNSEVIIATSSILTVENHSPQISDNIPQNMGIIQVWSLGENQELICVMEKKFDRPIYALSFSSDGEMLATGENNGSINLINWRKGGDTKSFSSCKNPAKNNRDNIISSIVFSRDGKIIASAGYDKLIRLWNTDSGELFQVLQFHEDKVLGVAFNQTSQIEEHLLVSASDDKTVRSYKIEGQGMWRVQPSYVIQGTTSWIWQLAYDSTGDLLAAACDNGEILLLDAKEFLLSDPKNLKAKILYSDKIRTWCLAFSPTNNKILATGGSNNQIKLWDVETMEEIDCLIEHQDAIRALSFSPDGLVLASASADSTVILWDLRELDSYLERKRKGELILSESKGIVESLKTFTDHNQQVWAVNFCQSKGRELILVTAGEDRKILFRSFTDGSDSIFNAYYRKDIKSSGATQSIVNIPKLESLECDDEHTDTIWSLVFDSKNSLLISASSDKKIKLWDMKTRKYLGNLGGNDEWHSDQVHALSITADSNFLVSGGNDAKIKIWDIKERKMLNYEKIANCHRHWIGSIVCHPKHPNVFASGSMDDRILLQRVDLPSAYLTSEHLEFKQENSFPKEYLTKPFADANVTGVHYPYKDQLKNFGAIEDDSS